MKPVALVLNFLPLIAFSLLARLLPHDDIGAAGLAGAALALLAVAVGRPVWPPRVLSACQLVLFLLTGILGFVLGSGADRWLATWGAAGIGLVIGLVVLALLPVMPFTEQFARQATPRARWNSPVFKKVNVVLSAVWGVVLVVLGAGRLAAAALGGPLPQVLLGAVVPVVVVLLGLHFSREYPKRLTRGEHPAEAASAGLR